MSQSDDRWAITDTLCRYARCLDSFDFEGVGSVFSDDADIEYGGYPVFHGGAEAMAFLQQHTASTAWQQHMVSVVDIQLDGDVANTVTYFIAHAVLKDDAEQVRTNVGDYRDRLHRTPDGWKIVERRQQTGWKETRRSVS
jgi:3-phenylpropionate/cinnamic acid dioxygenase small subunit